MTITETFLLLARARTSQDRLRILHKAASMGRFDEDQRAELRTLAGERDQSSMHALRPVTNPAVECKYLTPLELTQRPILASSIDDEIEEWVNGWRNSGLLELSGFRPPGALLLHGPTGTGKTMLCGTLAQRIGRNGVVAECHNLLDSHMGCTGNRLSEAFKATEKSGALFVLEELDALAIARGGDGSGASQENSRITVALMRLMESARFPIVATTNRLDALDPALVRRFEYKIELPPVAEEIRHSIIQRVLGHLPGELAGLELNEALPRAHRMARVEFLAKNAETSAA